MTLKEALEYWKFKHERAKNYTDDHWEADERHEHKEYVEAMQIAVEAIEKQIPMKVTHEATIYKLHTCPRCKNVVDKFEKIGSTIFRITADYCNFCGQKLDWNVSDNTCVCCGEIIPEGRQVCLKCERG